MDIWVEDSIISAGAGHRLTAGVAERKTFLESYKQSIFPTLGISTGQTIWKTYRNITRVTLWGREHFLNNVRLFMVAEALGLGPDYYCVKRSLRYGFDDRLFLLTRYLPAQKICCDPVFGLPPRGPFDRSIRARRVGEAIFERRIPTDDLPKACSVCHSHFCDQAMEDSEED